MAGEGVTVCAGSHEDTGQVNPVLCSQPLGPECSQQDRPCRTSSPSSSIFICSGQLRACLLSYCFTVLLSVIK